MPKDFLAYPSCCHLGSRASILDLESTEVKLELFYNVVTLHNREAVRWLDLLKSERLTRVDIATKMVNYYRNSAVECCRSNIMPFAANANDAEIREDLQVERKDFTYYGIYSNLLYVEFRLEWSFALCKVILDRRHK